MRQTPQGYRLHPAWIAFELWADAHAISDDHEEDWLPWWECFVAGFDVGLAEGLPS